jgi:hypothetical protein
MPYLAEIMRKKTKRKVWNLIDPLTHAIVGAGAGKLLRAIEAKLKEKNT